MAQKISKSKSSWQLCESCGCYILSKHKDLHSQMNCEKHHVKCPYVADKILHTWLELPEVPPENIHGNAVRLHRSVGLLIGANKVGQPVELRREGAPAMVKQLWLSPANAAPTAVMLNALDLNKYWHGGNDKEITVSILKGEIPEATYVTYKVLNHEIDEDFCHRFQFDGYFVSIDSILVYNYFGKMLEISFTDIRSDECNEHKKWYKLTTSTVWCLDKEIVDNQTQISLGGVQDIFHKIKTYISKSFNNKKELNRVTTVKSLLLYGNQGVGKTALCKYVIQNLNCYNIQIQHSDIDSKESNDIESKLKKLFDRAEKNAPSIIFVDDIESMCPTPSPRSTEQERKVTSAFINLLKRLHTDNNVFLLATSRNPEAIDSQLIRFGQLDQKVKIPVPDALGRKEILSCILKDTQFDLSSQDIISISELAHGYVAEDLLALCREAYTKCEGRITKKDLMEALDDLRPISMKEFDFEIPNIQWSDIGGQDDLKEILRQAINSVLGKDSKSCLGKASTNILLYGPPGCSKTMVVKALATESKFNFLYVNGPELYSKWLGDSEKNIRELFKKAREVAPSIIFLDEVDSIGTVRNEQEARVHTNMVNTLLTELDGRSPLQSVLVIAATNRPDMLDPALLRSGRFDSLIYVPLPDYETRFKILELKLNTMNTSDDVDIGSLAEHTGGFSGAELHGICNAAGTVAKREGCLAVTMAHFEQVLKNTKPITPEYLLRIYDNFLGKPMQGEQVYSEGSDKSVVEPIHACRPLPAKFRIKNNTCSFRRRKRTTTGCREQNVPNEFVHELAKIRKVLQEIGTRSTEVVTNNRLTNTPGPLAEVCNTSEVKELGLQLLHELANIRNVLQEIGTKPIEVATDNRLTNTAAPLAEVCSNSEVKEIGLQLVHEIASCRKLLQENGTRDKSEWWGKSKKHFSFFTVCVGVCVGYFYFSKKIK